MSVDPIVQQLRAARVAAPRGRPGLHFPGRIGRCRVSVDPIIAQLKAAREEAGVSQTQVARWAGLHPSTVCEAERGNHATTLPKLRRWARALGRDLALVDGPGSTSPEPGPEPGPCKLADWCVVTAPHDAFGCAQATSPEPGPPWGGDGCTCAGEGKCCACTGGCRCEHDGPCDCRCCPPAEPTKGGTE